MRRLKKLYYKYEYYRNLDEKKTDEIAMENDYKDIITQIQNGDILPRSKGWCGMVMFFTEWFREVVPRGWKL